LDGKQAKGKTLYTYHKSTEIKISIQIK